MNLIHPILDLPTHVDLKPENLLFRTDAEDAEVMIADFGLSRILDEGKMDKLTEVCGTPAYMAPEVFRKSASSSSPSLLPHSPSDLVLSQLDTANPSTFGL